MKRPVYVHSATQLLLQMQAAAEWQKREHERLIAAGYTWDGMDGYAAPPGTPKGE